MRVGDVVKRYGVTGTVLRVLDAVGLTLVRVHVPSDLMPHEAAWPDDECEVVTYTASTKDWSTAISMNERRDGIVMNIACALHLGSPILSSRTT
jgi:hypothetical protein